ncbi:MAG: amidohydrolase family protein [Nibricoccus sp.]
MRIIDAHVHLYPPEANAAPARWAEERGERHWATLCTRVRKNGKPVQAFPSLDELLRQMDEGGIERVVLQGWYWEKHDTCVEQNRFYEKCIRAHPDRLLAFGTFHAGAGEKIVCDEIRWAKSAGFCGLGELSPHSQHVAIDDRVWRKALGLAGELHLPVNLHVTEPLSKAYIGKVETPLVDFITMAREFPRTNFILAHWGARLPLDIVLGAEARTMENLYYDTAASPLLYDNSVFREMMTIVGPDHVLYGSDYPLNVYPRTEDCARLGSMLGRTTEIRFDEPEQKEVLFDTTARLLRFL